MATVRHEPYPHERVTALAADARKIVPLTRAAGVTPDWVTPRPQEVP